MLVSFPTTKKIRPFPKTMLAPLGATQTAVPRPICSLARSAVDPRLPAARSDPFRKTLKVSAPETVWSLIRTDQSVSAFGVSCLDPRVQFMLNHQPLLQLKKKIGTINPSFDLYTSWERILMLQRDPRGSNTIHLMCEKGMLSTTI